MLKNKQTLKKAIVFLVLDALAPVIGIIIMTSFVLPESVLAYILAIFVGEFLYIGASTLLPETREHLSKGIVIVMALGILLITLLTSFISF
jgi:ZIP family zinc transporter